MYQTTIPNAEPWSLLEKLNKEKDVTGIFILGATLWMITGWR